MALRIPLACTQAALRRIDHEHVGDDLRPLRGGHPGFVPIRIRLREAVARGVGADLQCAERAANLGVERVAELNRGIAQVALHPLALGDADLANPAVLQHREGRQQY